LLIELLVFNELNIDELLLLKFIFDK